MMMLYATNREPGVCPFCGEMHEIQTLRATGFHMEERGEDYSEDWLYCHKTTMLSPAGRNARWSQNGERFPVMTFLEDEILSDGQDGRAQGEGYVPEHMSGFYDGGDAPYDGYETEYGNMNGGDAESFYGTSGGVSERQTIPVCFMVTILRMREGEVEYSRNLLFSSYDMASSWLTGNGFFREADPWQIEPSGEGRQWVHEAAGPDDMLTASVETVNMDDGSPIHIELN